MFKSKTINKSTSSHFLYLYLRSWVLKMLNSRSSLWLCLWLCRLHLQRLAGLVELGATIGMEKEQVMSLLDAINGDLEATARYLLEDGGASSSASYPLTPDQQQQRQFETATRMANFVYVIVDDETHTAATVDAAWDVESVLTFAKSLGATVTAALYTHAGDNGIYLYSSQSGLSCSVYGSLVPWYSCTRVYTGINTNTPA